MSSTRAASSLFQPTASSTTAMCARSLSRSVGSRPGVLRRGASGSCRNSMSSPRIDRPGRRQRRPRHRALELADVARPVVAAAAVRRLGRQLLGVERQAVGGAVAAEEARRQHRDVHGALLERRQPDREGVDAVEQVFAEAALAHELSSGRLVAEISRKSTWIDLLPPSRSKRRSSSTRRSLACATSDRSPTSSRKKRAAVGQLEPARACGRARR